MGVDDLEIIKIPSSNIYELNPNPTPTNKFKTLSITTNELLPKTGNAAQPLTIEFWRKEPQFDESGMLIGNNWTYVGDEYGFPRYTTTTGREAALGKVTFNLKEFTVVDIRGEPNVATYCISHKLHVSEQRDADAEGVYSNIYTDTIQNVSYNAKEHSISFTYQFVVSYFVDKIPERLQTAELSLLGEFFSHTTKKITTVGTTEVQEEYTPDFVLPSNELENIENKIYGGSFTRSKLSDVEKSYRNGKEVYTIKCSVGNYYGTYGNLIISPDNSSYAPCFKKYDIVEPYVFTSRGEVPLSTKVYGTPKLFEVIGIDFSYKGVVWQELTLQEYN